MVKTIDDLEKCCMLDVVPTLPVITDYFDLVNVELLDIILGL